MDPRAKILIALPFWDKDKAQAMKLARLLADLQTRHSNEADILFVPRFDCSQDEATVKYVSRAFNVFQYQSKRREKGWPSGCNGIAFATFEWLYHMKAAGKIPNYKALFMCAADTAPLSKDCVAYLSKVWDAANKSNRVYVAGPIVRHESGHEHINGDVTLISGDLIFLKWLVKSVSSFSVNAGWDWFLASSFKAWGWADLQGTASLWNTPTMTPEQIVEQQKKGIVWLHGVKDNSVLDFMGKAI